MSSLDVKEALPAWPFVIQVQVGNLLQAVLINQGWECKDGKSRALVARLAKVPMAQLCPMGFVFIWVDKTLVGQLLSLESSFLLAQSECMPPLRRMPTAEESFSLQTHSHLSKESTAGGLARASARIFSASADSRGCRFDG